MYTTSSGTPSSPLQLEDVEKAVKDIEDFMKENKQKWILIDPQGSTWVEEDPLKLVSLLLSRVNFPTTFERLPTDMEKILNDNIGDLYER